MSHQNEAGFSLLEMVVTVAILSIAIATTLPIITRNRWQADVDQYALQLETGLYGLRAKLGAKKTSCTIDFPSIFTFRPPEELIEFSQNPDNHPTKFQCCDSTIVAAKESTDSGSDCSHPGNEIGDLTGNPLDNLRLVQQESSTASQAVRVAVSRTDFGFTPPGTTANAGTLTFLLCHNRALDNNNETQCIDAQNRLNIRCVQIDGTGGVSRGRWLLDSPLSAVSNGVCQTD